MFDCFLEVKDVPGESTDAKHKDSIDVLSFSWGANQHSSGSVSSGGGRSAERCDHEDFSIVHTLDKASPKLALYCCNGTHIPTVTVQLCRATGDKQQYMQYKMSDVIVTAVRPSGSSKGESALPVEEVCFGYGSIEWTYTETDHKTGKAKGDVKAQWSLEENKGG